MPGAVRFACGLGDKMFISKGFTAVALVAGLLVSGCSQHAYVSGIVAEDITDVERPSGAIERIPNSATSATIGLAYDRMRDRIYARGGRGKQVREIDRRSGAVLRSFFADRVTPGCGAVGVDPPVPVCGLAMRWRDRHLFLDDPTGNPITEVEPDGTFVRQITLRGSGSVISGLAYDQRSDTLYALHPTTRTVVEYRLDGMQLRILRPSAAIQPVGLSLNAQRGEIYIPLVNGTQIGVFDYAGNLIDQHPLQRAVAGFAGGVGAGPRWIWR